MTRLIGLKMQGIRSIGDEPHVVNFLTPLTIIQGENGTGKTTIIEALNFATTNALPSGKMVSFIHNNKLAKNRRVDALVQLKFSDPRGNTVIATKRMLSTLQAGSSKTNTKSEEFALKITDKDGRAEELTPKITDFNLRMEHHIGVPAAILQHVIFCHQDQSTWPLEEPKLLKNKFDAIFEVERYVKVIEAIRKLAKDLTAKCNEYAVAEPHRISLYTQRNAVYFQLTENQRKKEENDAWLRENKERINALDHSVNALHREKKDAEQRENLIKDKQTEIRVSKGAIRDVPAYDGTDDQLEEAIRAIKHSPDFTKSAEDKEKARRRQEVLEDTIKTYTRSQAEQRKKLSTVEGKQMMLDKAKCDHDIAIEEAKSKFGLTCDESDVVRQLQEQTKSIQAETTALKASKEGERQKQQAAITNIRDQISSFASVTDLKKKDIVQLKGAIQRLERAVSQSASSNDKLNTVHAEIGDRQKKLRRFQTERDTSIDEIKAKLEELSIYDKVDSDMSKMQVAMHNGDTLVTSNHEAFKTFFSSTIGDRAVQLDESKHELEEKREQLEAREADVKKAADSLAPLRQELHSLESALSDFNSRIESEVYKFTERASAVRASSARVSATQVDLEQLQRELTTLDVDEVRAQIAALDKKIDGTRSEIQQIAMLIVDCDNKHKQLRFLEDNYTNRRAQAKIAQLEEEIAAVRAVIVKPLYSYEDEYNNILRDRQKLKTEINQREGKVEELARSIKDMRKSVESDSQPSSLVGANRNKSPEELCREIKERLCKEIKEKIAEKVVLKEAIEELHRFCRIMDNAIIKYHAEKLQQINEILRELWPRVYQGNDIEAIYIRSQQSAGSDVRKTYDYYVMMVVDDVEIEMRDRCSAGQKMLASILIRIALAEVFGSNCQMLALDEPTTNLDQIKVENMATMLKDLLEACRTAQGEYGLQLIVITHDKRLVEHLYTICQPECVYSLSKDESGQSHIRMYRSIVDEPTVVPERM